MAKLVIQKVMRALGGALDDDGLVMFPQACIVKELDSNIGS